MGSKLADLPRLKINIFEAISSRPGVSSCKLWSLYRNGLRLFLLGSLPKCELDAIVCYTLGKENVHLHNELVQALLQKATAPKVPLLAKVAGYVDSAIKDEESRRLGGSPGAADDGEEDEESEEESEGSRREGLRFYEELRRRLARGGAVWDVHQYMNLVPQSSWSPRLPDDPASLAASIARAKASRAAASGSRPGPVVGGSSAMVEGTVEGAEGLKRKAAAELPGGSGVHPSQIRRLGEAGALGSSPGGLHQVKQEAGGMEAAGAAPSSSSDCSGLPPACLPSLQLVHHALRSAWHKQQDPPPAPVEGQQPPQVVSMQATLLLNEAVKDFTRRVLRRCMHVAKAERSRAASSSATAAGGGGEAAPRGATAGGGGGGGGGASGPSGAAPQQPSVSSSTLMIGPSTVLRALKVPSADQRDPIGRSFPGPGLLEDMFCLSFY